MGIVADEREQQEEAARRIAERTQEREQNVKALREGGGFGAVNSGELVARRLDRLARYSVGDQLPGTEAQAPTGTPEKLAAEALRRAALAGLPDAAEAAAAPSVEGAAAVLEAVIGSSDFLDVRWLEAGVAAARAVGRIHIHTPRGNGYGSGSLVTPRLLLTNHHVLRDAGIAATSQVEFNFQIGLDGQPLQPRIFALDPEAFFLNDPRLDFALVAVAAAPGVLAEFGVNRFVEAGGKAGVGEFATVIQHPAARYKEIALRENRIVDETEIALHYSSDTERGSSGSPVFNDQWEIVALHHASVDAPGQAELGGIVNEGIRISQIAGFVRAQSFAPPQQALAAQLGAFEQIVVTTRTESAGPAAATAGAPSGPNGGGPTATGADGGPPEDGYRGASATAAAIAQAFAGRAELSIPLELTVGLRAAGLAAGLNPQPLPPVDPNGPAQLEPGVESIVIDPDYSTRRGYDPAFLGASAPVPLPELSADLRAQAAVNEQVSTGVDPHVLPYHHFSVVIDRERRLARYTAVNIDGGRALRLRRERDRWILDPRVPADQQTGEAVYERNALDRGHLVRRLDPAWGGSQAEAKLANDDTFHFTNCTPQHEDFNQSKTTWAGLEDYILENADNRDLRVNVFSGPVLADDDDVYKGVKLPRQFWKVVTIVKASGALSATAYLLSQEQLLHDGGFEATLPEEEFSYGAYKTFQVPVSEVERVTGLSFGTLRAADPLARLESAGPLVRPVEGPSDLVL